MADGFFTCNTGWTGADARAQQQFDYLDHYTTVTFNEAIAVVGQIGALQLPSFTFSLDPISQYDFSIEGYVPAPTLDSVDLTSLDKDFPGPPVDKPPTTLDDLGPLPNTPPDPPNPVFDPEPDVYNPQFAAPPPIVIPPTPTMIDYTGSIPQPVILPITLPPVPDIDLDSLIFTATPPVFTAIPPDANDFRYAEPDYMPQLTEAIKPVLASMLAGNSGLTTAIETAIWSRDYEKEDEAASRAVDDAMDDWASRGFSLPGGPLNKTVRMVRQNNQNQRNSHARDVAVITFNALREDLKFSVAQSLAYEDMFIRLFNEQQNRKLQAARFAIDLAIAVFNALVGQFQAQAQVYKVEADVFLAMIQAQIAKIQVYAEEIKAQSLIEGINEQSIKIYLGRLSAIETNIRAYVGATEGYKNVIDGGRLILEEAKMLIDEEVTKLSASELKFKIWQGQAQQQQIVQSAYATRTQTFLAAMQGYDIRAKVDIEKLRVDIANTEAVSARYQALLTGFTALVNYVKAKAELTIENNTQRVQVYSADVQGKSAYNNTITTKMLAVNQALIEKTKIILENADINKRNLIEGIKIAEQQLAAMANVLSALGSAALSAAHVAVGISDTSAVSTSCNFNTSQQLSTG
jgi:hypothetical protein